MSWVLSLFNPSLSFFFPFYFLFCNNINSNCVSLAVFLLSFPHLFHLKLLHEAPSWIETLFSYFFTKSSKNWLKNFTSWSEVMLFGILWTHWSSDEEWSMPSLRTCPQLPLWCPSSTVKFEADQEQNPYYNIFLRYFANCSGMYNPVFWIEVLAKWQILHLWIWLLISFSSFGE